MKKNQISLITIIFLWLAYLAIYICLKQKNFKEYSGILALIGQSGLDLLAVYYSWKLMQHTSDSVRKIFQLLTLSFIFAFLADTSYNIIVNIQQANPISDLLDSVFDVPFLCFLTLQFISWIKISSTSNLFDIKYRKKTALLCTPVFLIAVIISAIFIFTFQWKINLVSLTGIYQITDTIIDS